MTARESAFRWAWLGAAVFVAAGLLLAAAPPANDKTADAARIARLIGQLGDEEYARREAAGKALEEIGVPAFAALRRAAASADPEVRRRATRLLRVITGRLFIRRFEGHSDGVIAVALSPDGKRALSGPVCYTSKDSAARLWDVATGKELRRFEGHMGGVYAVAFSPDGKWALTAGDKTVRLWDVETGKELKRFEGHTDHVYDAIFTPDGKSVLSASKDLTARLWDVATGKELKRFEGHASMVRKVAFAPDSQRILSRSICEEQSIRLWDVRTGKQQKHFDLTHPPSRQGTPGTVGVAFSPDGKLVAIGGQDDLVRLWDAEKGKVVRLLKGHTAEVGPVAFTPDGNRLLSGGDDQTVRLWDVQSGEELCCLRGHTHRVWAITCSRDGRYALSSSFDRTIRLWQLPD